ncbi:EAL and HDOD domain-containing protein [Pseudazoarcus pumilus]|uniref:Signal transduction protein n=1 Tax=Pseudazoarcus pumilus TaxID=2067960 RepID=A0A2I6S6Q9_9RHOO|nr:HDOD domain-containing protein [Pseudazoarcus pumilus]AUN94950.1 signal transduction protein [Pseudazoarcus pumilus]
MGLFDALLKWFGLRRESPREDGFTTLNHRAPLRSEETAGRMPEGALLCREAVLGRDQRVAGYRFQLRESTRNRIRRSSRIVHHVYAEVLVGGLVQSDIPCLLGHRLAFVEVPDSFLSHASLQRLPSDNTVIVAVALEDPADAPSGRELIDAITMLRSAGYRTGLRSECAQDVPQGLVGLLDHVLVSGTDFDPVACEQLLTSLRAMPHPPACVATDLATLDDFQYFHALGAQCFHGPFVSRREQWEQTELSPDLVQARPLLAALQRDAADAEIVALTKRNPAVALRLLRYANSAASGVERRIDSIEQALQLVGRARLARWVTMVLFAGHPDHGRSAAALEAALVRARMLELLGQHAGRDAETLFLVGLLSLVDVVFRTDIGRALDVLAVSDEIREAIVERRGRLYAPLALACAWEDGEVDEVTARAAECGIGPQQAADLHLQALRWALQVRN